MDQTASTKPQIIEITVAPDGAVAVETTGFTGKSCQVASMPYEEALGTRQSEVMTPESRVQEPPVKAVLKHRLG